MPQKRERVSFAFTGLWLKIIVQAFLDTKNDKGVIFTKVITLGNSLKI